MKWITVSRKMGTRGSDIAKRVASELRYRFYDTDAISTMAQELGVLDSVRVIDEQGKTVEPNRNIQTTTHNFTIDSLQQIFFCMYKKTYEVEI